MLGIVLKQTHCYLLKFIPTRLQDKIFWTDVNVHVPWITMTFVKKRDNFRKNSFVYTVCTTATRNVVPFSILLMKALSRLYKKDKEHLCAASIARISRSEDNTVFLTVRQMYWDVKVSSMISNQPIHAISAEIAFIRVVQSTIQHHFCFLIKSFFHVI